MTAADMFRGLAEFNLTTQPGADPANPYVAALPTFGKFAGNRDEFVLLRHNVARGRAIRLLNAPGGLAVWDENDVPAVFRALNPADHSKAAFPTFTYGFSNGQRFMNIVDMVSFSSNMGSNRPYAGTFTVFEAQFSDLTNVESSMREAHAIARADGFSTGYPTFHTRVDAHTGEAMADLVVFDGHSSGVHVISDPVPSGSTPQTSLWSFETLPDLCDAGMALVVELGERVLIDSFDGALYQRRPASSPHKATVSIDPDAAGTHRSPDGVGFYPGSQVSAVTTSASLEVLWSDRALFLASRPLAVGGPIALPPTDDWSYSTVFGRTQPDPAGWVGYRNTAVVAPDGTLHVFGYLSERPDTPVATPVADLDPDATYNLLHRSRTGSAWAAEETVDGDGVAALGHVDGNVGLYSAAVTEPDGTVHVFYMLAVNDVEGRSTRLRHAVATSAGWVAETLDGSGASTEPPLPGTGPTRAAVGGNVTAAFFDGSIWVVYDDSTYGNLRCARGTRVGAELQWEFHILDGAGAGTSNTVQAAVLLPWDDVLSVFYYDQQTHVIRHAYRKQGTNHWLYEVVDGAGGPDGRVAGPVTPYITAASSLSSSKATTSPVFVGYLWWPVPHQATGQVRIATLTGHL